MEKNNNTTAKRKKPSVTMEEIIDEDKCVHDHNYLGISFNPEPNGDYWKPKASMCGVLCKSCNGSFYGDHKKCKISVKRPAMTCKGREKYGCTYCLCNICFTTKLINTTNDNKRTKRSRRTVVNSNA